MGLVGVVEVLLVLAAVGAGLVTVMRMDVSPRAGGSAVPEPDRSSQRDSSPSASRATTGTEPGEESRGG